MLAQVHYKILTDTRLVLKCISKNIGIDINLLVHVSYM